MCPDESQILALLAKTAKLGVAFKDTYYREGWLLANFASGSPKVLLPTLMTFTYTPKLYIPSTLNTDYLLWHTQLIVCSKILNQVFLFSLFKFLGEKTF